MLARLFDEYEMRQIKQVKTRAPQTVQNTPVVCSTSGLLQKKKLITKRRVAYHIHGSDTKVKEFTVKGQPSGVDDESGMRHAV
jgi:hypothetical protein